jgi:hypothetical protein
MQPKVPTQCEEQKALSSTGVNNDRQIHRALNRRPHLPQPDNEPHSVAFLSFVGTTSNHVSRVLALHNIKSVDLKGSDDGV